MGDSWPEGAPKTPVSRKTARSLPLRPQACVPYYTKEMCRRELEVIEKRNGACTIERCRKEEINTVRSWQTLEAYLLPGPTVKTVRSRLRGRPACHLVP